jgi:hypothetical protein
MTMTMRLLSPALLRLQALIFFALAHVWYQPKPPAKKRYAVKARPLPVRVRDSVQILELTQALGDAEAALVVWTLRGWLAVNKANKRNLREGHYWTYNPLPEWCEKHFQWMTVDQLSYLMKKLAKLGVVIRQQFYSPRGKCYWYRLDEEVISRMILETVTRKSPDASLKNTGETRKSPNQGRKSPAHTTKESSSDVSSIPDSTALPTTTEQGDNETDDTTDTDVVVVSPALPHHPEAESGEHNLDGEGHDTTAVKALAQNELHHDEEPLSKVPLKVLSGVGSELVKFGVLPVTAQRLVEQYPEADVQYVLTYTQASGKLGPGFVIDELDHRRFGVLLARDSNLLAQKVLHASSTELDEGRLEAIRLQNERWAAEDAAAEQAALDPEHMLIPAVPDASDPDALHRLRTDGALV